MLEVTLTVPCNLHLFTYPYLAKISTGAGTPPLIRSQSYTSLSLHIIETSFNKLHGFTQMAVIRYRLTKALECASIPCANIRQDGTRRIKYHPNKHDKMTPQVSKISSQTKKFRKMINNTVKEILCTILCHFCFRSPPHFIYLGEGSSNT